MKVALWIMGGLASLAALVVLVGFMLPATRTGKVDRVVEVTPAQLNAVILDRASQPTWRPELAKVEMQSTTSWTETTQRGQVIAFELTRQDVNLLQMRFESSYGYLKASGNVAWCRRHREARTSLSRSRPRHFRRLAVCSRTYSSIQRLLPMPISMHWQRRPSGDTRKAGNDQHRQTKGQRANRLAQAL